MKYYATMKIITGTRMNFENLTLLQTSTVLMNINFLIPQILNVLKRKVFNVLVYHCCFRT